MLARTLIAEFIGTFFLVLVIAMTAFDPGLPAGLAPIAIASVLAAMIFALGHVSGAYFNPVVSLVMTVGGVCPRSHLLPLVAIQIVAALLAAWLAFWLCSIGHGDGMTITPISLEPVSAVLLETLFTFAMVLVILNVGVAKALESNQFSGLAIGLVVLAGAYVAGPISGGAFNPAVTTALTTTGILGWGDLWLHLIGQLAGGLLALAVFVAGERLGASEA